jgi:RNA polymerase sigma-70 factor (ECF subfamily)
MVSTLVPSALMPPAAPVPPASQLEADAGELRLVVRAVIAAIMRERPDHADVEDCTNETMRRALESRGKPRGPMRAWVVGIARHVALDALRSRQRQRARSQEPPSSSGAALADPGALADVEIENTETAARVRRILAGLPEGQRRALELFHIEELPYQEIARRLEVPLGTVATWVTRGRKTIAEALEEEVRR